MSGNFLLDTNIIIAIGKGEPSACAALVSANEVYISAISIGELYYGANNSSRMADNIADVDSIVQNNTIIDCDSATAKIYGQIKKQLKIQGTPIPENDIWIAAIALQYNLILATRDQHFRHIQDLITVDWL